MTHKPLTRKQLADIDRQEREWNAEVRKRMDELQGQGVAEQEAFDRAWVDCGGLIFSDEELALMRLRAALGLPA